MTGAVRNPLPAVVEAGVHRPAVLRRHADRVLPVHELIVVQAGTLPIAEEDRRFEVRRDEWVLLRAGRRHFGTADLDRETWFFWLCFGDTPEAAGVDDAVIDSGRRTGTVSRPDRMRTHFEHLLEDQHRGILSPAIARSYLHLLIAETRLPATADEHAEAVPALAERASAYIAAHLSDPELCTARIATSLACGPDYLGRLFRSSFDETITDHIHRLRIEKALTLFRTTGLPSDRVAAAVGFSDVRYFRRIFKRRIGLTASQFRRLRPPHDGSAPRPAPDAGDGRAGSSSRPQSPIR
jgi:AraC-like DNA-binding protein